MSFLSPLDLLTVSNNEQDIIRCLVRRPKLTINEIAKFTNIPLSELECLLTSMVRNAHLFRDDEDKFNISYGRSRKPKQESAGDSLLSTLF